MAEKLSYPVLVLYTSGMTQKEQYEGFTTGDKVRMGFNSTGEILGFKKRRWGMVASVYDGRTTHEVPLSSLSLVN